MHQKSSIFRPTLIEDVKFFSKFVYISKIKFCEKSCILAWFLNLIVPCVLISMLSPFTFLLPGCSYDSYLVITDDSSRTLADSGEKISLGVTILLSLTVFQLIVAEQMPPSEDIPIIGEFYSGFQIYFFFGLFR